MAKNRTRIARKKATAGFMPVIAGSRLQPKGFGLPQAAVPGWQAKEAGGFDAGRVPLFPAVQAKLTVGAPNDKYEQEADAVAAQVVERINSPQPQQTEGAQTGAVQRQAGPEEEELQQKPLAESIQRQEAPEEEELQQKPLAESIQRQEAPEEEELQQKPLTEGIQRQEMPEEEEAVQAKPLVESIQRQEAPEEEEIQQKPLAESIQRQEAPEEEELQQKPLADVQRQEAGPEEEEAVQAKPDVQREAMPEEEEAVQKKTLVQRKATGAMAASQPVESTIAGARGQGQGLDDGTRGKMEGAFGADFGEVRVHTDERSDQLNRSLQSRAFATGQDIFFKRGEFNPGSRGGQELLAHELTHVVQQNRVVRTGNFKSSAWRKPDKSSLLKQQKYNETVGKKMPKNDELSQYASSIKSLNKRINLIHQYNKSANTLGNSSENKLGMILSRYNSAYATHQNVLNKAKLSAENKEYWANLASGVIIGVGFGVLAAYALPAAEAASFYLSLGAAMGAARDNAGLSIMSAATGITANKLLTFHSSAAKTQPGTPDPKLLKLKFYKNLTKLYKSSSTLSQASYPLISLTIGGAYVLGRIESKPQLITNPKVKSAMQKITSLDKQLSKYDSALISSASQLKDMNKKVASINIKQYSNQSLEQFIWVLWLSQLAYPGCKVILESSIYNQLKNRKVIGSNSMLDTDEYSGVFGSHIWSLSVVNSARSKAKNVRSQYRALQGVSV